MDIRRAWLRSLTVIAMGTAGGLLVSPAAGHGSPAIVPAGHQISSETRIWYRDGRLPQLSLPGGRHETVRSLLNITEPMQFGDFVWNEDHIPNGPVWLRVDLSSQLLSVFRAGHEIGSAVILYGSDGTATPTGSFTILEKAAHYYSHSYHAPMPYMLRLTRDGVAIHGSNVREGWATHGCIGVPLDFARRLFEEAAKGDMVTILPAKS